MSNDLLGQLQQLGELVAAEKKEYEAANDAWWDSLTEKEREDAFYAVVKRIYKGDVVDRGSFRYVLYEIFGFGMHMYGRGMDCGYMYIHNAIAEGEKTDDEVHNNQTR